MIKLKILILILFLILSSRVYAVYLGSVVKNNFIELSNEESGKFKILFWNTDNESYFVKLTATELPKDWTVIIDPNEFYLNKTIGEEYISLPYTNENVKAKVVNVFVKPDKDSKPGNYSVVVKAETVLKQNEINGVTVVPERLFKFEVDIKGPVSSVDDYKASTENKIDYKIESVEKNYENISDTSDKKYFYLAIVSLVVIISIIIYKKS